MQSLRKYFHNKSEQSSLYAYAIKIDKRFIPLNLHDNSTQYNEQITTKQQKIDIWSKKYLHGRHRAYLCQPYVDKNASNKWLKRGELFPETEASMVAIQDQTIATRNYTKHIIKDRNLPNDSCRHCNTASETIQHITGACKTLVQTDYKHRHDQVASIVHQYIAHKYKFIENKVTYYKYNPTNVLENAYCKIYWNRTIIADETIHFNKTR